MLGTSDQSAISNQQRIQQLKERIKNADSLYPKSAEKSKDILQISTSPMEDTFHQPSKSLNKTSVNRQQATFPLQLRYGELEDKMNTRMEQEYRLLESVEADISILQQQVRLTKKIFEKSRDNWQERALSIERQVSQQVMEQTEEIKSLRKDLIDSIQKKYKTIKTQTMSVLGNHFESGWQEAKEEICSKIQDLKIRIDTEEAAKDESVNYMVNGFGQQILKLEQLVQKQRQDRAESHQKVMISLQRMEQDITVQILQQKKQANQSIAELQNCLEELCFKIENYLLQ